MTGVTSEGMKSPGKSHHGPDLPLSEEPARMTSEDVEVAAAALLQLGEDVEFVGDDREDPTTDEVEL